jgi:type IV secretory pathway VirB2 component (pilin)
MKKLKTLKAALVTAFLSTATGAPLFASSFDVPPQMQDLADSAVEILTGPLVRTFFVIILVACAIAFGFNKDNEKMKRNIIIIFVAAIVILSASTIIENIWT